MIVVLSCALLCTGMIAILLVARLISMDRGIEYLLSDQRRLPALLIKRNRLLGDHRLQRFVLLHKKLTSEEFSSMLLQPIRSPDTPERPPSEERIEETTRHLLRSSKVRAWHLAYTMRCSGILRTCSAGIQLTEVLHRLQSRYHEPKSSTNSPKLSPVADPALRWCGITQECVITDQSEGATFHLWLGYPSDTLLNLSEIERVHTLVTTVRREICDLAALEALSSRASEESQSRKNKEQFFSHVAHDLRSPLGNLRAILQAFGKGELSDELLRFGSMNCDRIEQLTSDIIVLSKEQAGALRAHPHPFIIGDLMRSISGRFLTMATQKKLELIVPHPPELPPVWADPSHVTRILENLVSNAIKHTWSGTITLSAESGPEGFIRCIISDTGEGIPSEKLDSITTPYHQIQDSISDGVGLGLAIAKLLTETNRGVFSVTSMVGAGSQFSVDLPVWRPGETARVQ
jgi:signal transduction histidine kinase